MSRGPLVHWLPSGEALINASGLIRFLVEVDEMPPNKHRRAQIEKIQRIGRAAIATAELLSPGPIDKQAVLERVFDIAYVERTFMSKGDIDGLLAWMTSRGAAA